MSNLVGLILRQGLAELFFCSLLHEVRSLRGSQLVNCYSGESKIAHISDILVGWM